MLLLTSTSGKYFSPLLSVAPFSTLVVNTNLFFFFCQLVNVTYFYPEHIFLSRSEFVKSLLDQKKDMSAQDFVIIIIFIFFFQLYWLPNKNKLPMFSDLASQNYFWKQ